jgi:hypothetical protein
MRPVYQQLCDALTSKGFRVELDAHHARDERREVVGPAAFRLLARRCRDGNVIAQSHWTPEPEDAARSLATNMLMIADPQVREVVGELQL